MPKSDTAFSVSAAKAFFESAKKSEVRQSAAKNPFVRTVVKSAALNPVARSQLIAALEKQFGSNDAGEKASSTAAKPESDDTPSPPPPHRGTSNISTSSSYSSPSYRPSSSSVTSSLSNYSKPLPAVPSTSTSPPKNGIVYPSLVNELQELQLSTPGKIPPPTLPSPAVVRPGNQAVSLSHPHGVVKFSFNGSQEDELTCAAGDTVVLKQEVDEQWIYGQNSRTGRFGIIPLSFLDVRIPLIPTLPSSVVIATALYDYDSETRGDLTFRTYDRIVVIERVGPEWLRGSLHSRQGIFPANFVSCPEIDSLPMAQLVVPCVPLEKMTAAYDYSSGVQGDLVLKAGDTVEVIAHLDQDWVRGRAKGQEGLVPLSFLAPYGTPVKSPNARGIASIAALGGSGRVVTAIADHYTDDPNKLYFLKGDRIIIVEDVDNYWYRGKLEAFKTLPAGLFPKAIVKED